jgi:hypothetical protein
MIAQLLHGTLGLSIAVEQGVLGELELMDVARHWFGIISIENFVKPKVLRIACF